MKTKTTLITLIYVLALSALVLQGCEKDDEPNKSPTCQITSPSDGEEFEQGEILIISVNATDSDGNIAEVRFLIDDVIKGSVSNSPFSYDWNTSDESIGNHTLKATSIDNVGANTSDELSIEIIEGGGKSDFIANPTSGVAPLTVNFTDQSTNNPTSWDWNFGDNGNSTEQSPSHTYNNLGQYNVTLIASNENGSVTETKMNFILVKEAFTDPRDNQIYSIVSIGDQTWFAENLNYETPNSWWYDNSSANGDVSGRLYIWAEVQSACPIGWHAAYDNDWKKLEMYLGMSQSEVDQTDLRGTDEGTRLKSTTGWNLGLIGTDELGFAAIPGGIRNPIGTFNLLNGYACWWMMNELSTNQAWRRWIEDGSEQVGRGTYNKEYGFSIRCVKN